MVAVSIEALLTFIEVRNLLPRRSEVGDGLLETLALNVALSKGSVAFIGQPLDTVVWAKAERIE
ncbi:hypothetical protein ATE69_18575 [Sphingopyxis sp. H071]|nr:hypothetical protein ATE61_17780 [Sphingopyxis sp. H057]KTE48477.1 hypothetical protein ATE64_20620 [Sphingopyxis sp. H073]KTE50076.1 hypothetical protein ATE69_18575 [Sphingopyxis sp. H071]KTE58517.1 hypothetical protein ATE66_15165 [Sphingopyxis sp. H107]KTE63216.1 hypothetical protein ATE65_16290 [Sphingopyxis sp. H100]KTE70447.1 hypothetical protein ATE60_15260 [Sphingopyxis sp. H081]KTE77297.1 hypothetical protein ATE63_17850 [Sphingopyxis sp. H067]